MFASPMSTVAGVEAQSLMALQQRAERGERVSVDEIAPLTRSTDRAVRGVAKRLLARMLIERARYDAGQLLFEACDDLDHQLPLVLNEAVASGLCFGQTERIVDLWLSAAESALRRTDHVTTLVYLLNAAASDFRSNHCRRIGDAEYLRRFIELYEQVAAQTRGPLGIEPAVRRRRRSPPGERLRLAHVVGQIVDGPHSTSQVTRTMLKYADHERFGNYLFVSEALGAHAQHQAQCLISEPSNQRGLQTIRQSEQEWGIPVVLPADRRSFLTSAAELHRKMAELQIDVAFFHGSIATPTDWMMCAWQAAPWQFDRGFGVPLYCPAVDYQFFDFEELMEKHGFLYGQRGVPYGHIPYGTADLSHVETAQPYGRAELGIPAGHVVLGTSGNHLPSRMSPDFCATVAGVLHQCPNTTYLVVGPGTFEAQRGALGAELCRDNGPSARVRFVGSTDTPQRWARTFDIYVNEFPAGGGLAVCEAMAAGKAVVCMTTDTTSLSLVGAFYVGKENVVQPPTCAAYAARLGQLITDRAQREQLAQALSQRYRTHFTGGAWVRETTDRIWQIVNQG